MFRLMCLFCIIPVTYVWTKPAEHDYLDTASIERAFARPLHLSAAKSDSVINEVQMLYRASVRLGYWKGRMHASSLLGYCYSFTSNEELAMLHWDRCLRIANERPGFNTEVAAIYSTIGSVNLSNGDYQTALVWYAKMKNYIDQYKGHYHDRAEWNLDAFDLNQLLARCYFRLGDIKEGEKCYRKAIGFWEADNMEQTLSLKLVEYYRNLATDNYPTCERLYFECRAIVRKMDGNDKRAMAYYALLPELYVKMKRYELVYAYSDSLTHDELYRSFIPYKIKYERNLIAADSAMGRYASAFQRFRKIQLLKDSLNSRNQSLITAYYRTELDVNSHIQALKSQQELSRSQTIIFVFIIITSGLIGTVLYLRAIAKAYRLRASHQKERLELGNDVHDNINPLLSYVRIVLSNMQLDDRINAIQVRELVSVLDSTIQEIRSFSSWIRNMNQFEDFRSAVSDMLNRSCAAYKLSLMFKYQVDDKDLTALMKQNIYLILEELILNTWKHANADAVTVILSDNGTEIKLQYSDNGTGFSFEQQAGTGLLSITRRVERHNGKIEFESNDRSPGASFYIILAKAW